jgi:tungstate transport system ATP-binding protein
VSDRTHLPIRLEGVGLRLGGVPLLTGIDLELRAGSTIVVLGPNGAGKSLLLRLCHGLLAPSEGRIGTRLGAGVCRRARVRQAMVFQKPVLLRRSVAANIRFVLAARGVPYRQRGELAAAALDRFRLTPLAARPARVLSGGEQQRLALARAWALEPELLLLDEPSSALDPAATQAVEGAIRAFKAAGTTIVMSTHDLGQARRLADEVAFMIRGRLVEHAPASTFFTAPRTIPAAGFLRGELVL